MRILSHRRKGDVGFSSWRAFLWEVAQSIYAALFVSLAVPLA